MDQAASTTFISWPRSTCTHFQFSTDVSLLPNAACALPARSSWIMATRSSDPDASWRPSREKRTTLMQLVWSLITARSLCWLGSSSAAPSMTAARLQMRMCASMPQVASRVPLGSMCTA
jgi:hypothetical protein